MTGFLSPKHAAQYCDMSLRSFQRWVKADGLRADGLAGARLRYSVALLDKWLAFRRDHRKAS